jgi:protein SDA1
MYSSALLISLWLFLVEKVHLTTKAPVAGMGRAAILPSNYPHLQNLIKRDAASYAQEFAQQYLHFKASLAIVEVRPSAADDHFEALVTFLSHVAGCYPESRQEFPGLITGLLEREAAGMNASLRRALVQGLLLLRKHGLLELQPLLELFFRLLRVQDKALREMLYTSIVGEVRRANLPHKNNGLNRSLQNYMYGLFEEHSGTQLGTDENLALDRILQIIIELYRKRIWDDVRTVNVVADAAVRKVSPKVMNTALNFFVGRFRGKALADESDEEDEEGNEYKELLQKSSFSGSNKRSTAKKLKKALNDMHRKERKTQSSDRHGSFAAIHLLHDPQGFVEKLFAHLKRSNDPFELKLLMMNVISRVIGSHRLLLLDFYSFLHRYIQPHQKEVTQILAYAAQATHDLLPSDVMAPLLTAIAHNFAAEHCAN